MLDKTLMKVALKICSFSPTHVSPLLFLSLTHLVIVCRDAETVVYQSGRAQLYIHICIYKQGVCTRGSVNTKHSLAHRLKRNLYSNDGVGRRISILVF